MGGVLAHEIGHNFGMEHANSVSFNAARGTFTNVEYGDEQDVMGGSFDMITGDFHAGYKHALGWIDNAHVAQVDPLSQSSLTVRLGASDRNNSIGLAPFPLPKGVVLAARAVIPARTSYMPASSPAYLYLSYKSADPKGPNGVFLNEVPIDTAGGTVGPTYIVCPGDVACSVQTQVKFSDAYLYDPADQRLLIELGPRERIIPGPDNATAQDSAALVRLVYLDAAGVSLNAAAEETGCTDDGCAMSPAAVDATIANLTCGSVVPNITLTSVRQVAVFRVVASPSSSPYMTIDTCPPDGSAPAVPVGVSVFVGGFPVSHAYYGGNVGGSGDAFSDVTYTNYIGTASLPCGRVSIAVPGDGLPAWVVVGASGTHRGRRVSVSVNATCSTRGALSWFPSAIMTSSICSSGSSAGPYALVANSTFSGQPVWRQVKSPNRFLTWSGSRWTVVTSVGDSAYFCQLGTTADYTKSAKNWGVCPAGSFTVGDGTCGLCPNGRVAPPGSTSSSACRCPDEWMVDASTQLCRGPSVGGPADLRSNWTAIVRDPVPLPASAAAPGAGGASSSSGPARFYETIYFAKAKFYDGFFTRVPGQTVNSLPYYSNAAQNVFLANCGGTCWAVVDTPNDSSSAWSYFSTPSGGLPPTSITGVSTYALCDGQGDRAIDFNARGARLCFCPAGMSPDSRGLCQPCAIGAARSAPSGFPTNDTCVPCAAGTTTSSVGQPVCDVSLCTGFNVTMFYDPTSDCGRTPSYAGCSAARTELNGAYYLRQLPAVGEFPTYARSDGRRFLHRLSIPPVWAFDSDLNATNGVLYKQSSPAAASFVVPLALGIKWTTTSASQWWITLSTNATCSQCGRGSYGSLVGAAAASDIATACKLCPAGFGTNVTSSFAATAVSACSLCAPGFGGPACSRCGPSSFKAELGNATCSACPANTSSTGSAGLACACAAGFKADGGGGCVDIDECASGTSGCTGGWCTNTMGGFTCGCANGTALSADDGRTCVACGPSFFGDGVTCSPCPPFMTREGASSPACSCAPPHIVVDDGQGGIVCRPPLALSLDATSSGGIAASLELVRLQYVAIPVPGAPGALPATVAVVPSPVYKRVFPTSSPSFPARLPAWLAWNGNGAGGGREQRWVLATSVNVSANADGGLLLLPLLGSAADAGLNDARGSGTFAYAPSTSPALPRNGSASSVVWKVYQARPLRMFADALAEGVSLVSAGRAAAPTLTTPLLSNISAGSPLRGVQVTGLAGPGDILTFRSRRVPACTGAAGAPGAALDANLTAVGLAVPSAAGPYELCVSSLASSSLPVPVVYNGSGVTMLVETGSGAANSSPTPSTAAASPSTTSSSAAVVSPSSSSVAAASPSSSSAGVVSPSSSSAAVVSPSSSPAAVVSPSSSSAAVVSPSSSSAAAASPSSSSAAVVSPSSSSAAVVSPSSSSAAAVSPSLSSAAAASPSSSSAAVVSPSSSSAAVVSPSSSSAAVVSPSSSSAAVVSPSSSSAAVVSPSSSAAAVSPTASSSRSPKLTPSASSSPAPVAAVSFTFNISAGGAAVVNASIVSQRGVALSIRRSFAALLGIRPAFVRIKAVIDRRTRVRYVLAITDPANTFDADQRRLGDSGPDAALLPGAAPLRALQAAPATEEGVSVEVEADLSEGTGIAPPESVVSSSLASLGSSSSSSAALSSGGVFQALANATGVGPESFSAVLLANTVNVALRPPASDPVVAAAAAAAESSPAPNGVGAGIGAAVALLGAVLAAFWYYKKHYSVRAAAAAAAAAAVDTKNAVGDPQSPPAAEVSHPPNGGVLPASTATVVSTVPGSILEEGATSPSTEVAAFSHVNPMMGGSAIRLALPPTVV
jgi:hypothetical protein